jgi:adenylate cyclase
MSLYAELKRRGVLKVGGAYVVVAWVIVQVASIVLPTFEAPVWVLRAFILLLMLGFPLALVLAWVLEITPEGMRVETAPVGNKRMFGIAAGLAALAMVWYFVGQPALRGGAAPAPANVAAAPVVAKVAQRSIAVLPFVDMSQDKDQEYFSDGITEEILNALTRIEGLKVAGRTSSFHFKGRNEDLKAIGAALGVAHVLEGSVRKQGDRIRITAQLIQVDDGFHVWSQNYDRKLDDIFAVQDEISTAIATALKGKLALAGGTTTSIDPRTYDIYLRARQTLARRTIEDINEAAGLFAQVTTRDPAFAAAWSGQAKALSLVWGYAGGAAPRDTATRARAAAERALALDPANAEAQMILAYVDFLYLWKWDDGLRGIEAAIAMAPNDAEVANFAGDIFRMAGDLENGERWERRSVELDPLFDVNHSDLGWVLLSQRRHDEAAASAARAIQLDPTYWSAYDVRARAFLWLGETANARREAGQLVRYFPNSAFEHEFGARLALADGDEPLARKHLAELQRRASAGEMQHYVIAYLQALLGDHDDAARSLEHAYALRDPTFASDAELFLPEQWPDHPAIRAALDKPDLVALYAMRRRFHAAAKAAPVATP